MKVSVVMPVYNSEKYLQETIDSILNQTYQNFELIIVNDGSTDHSKEILDQLQDDRVKVFHSMKNNGAPKSLNIGIGHSTGDWIFIHDSDDISYPNRIELQVKHINENPEIVAVCSMVKCFSESPNINLDKVLGQESYHNKLTNRELIWDIRFHGCPLMHGTVAFSRKAYDMAGGYDPSFKIVYDYDLWMRLFQLGPIDIVPEILYKYRVHEHSLSHKNWITTSNELNIVSTKYIKKLLRSKIGKEPTFIVMGPEKGIENFIQNVAPVTDLNVKKYISNNLGLYSDYAIKKILRNKADAVIILDNYITNESSAVFQKFIQDGLEKNENLFIIHNEMV